MDIVSFAALGFLTVGINIMRDLDLPPPPPTCKTELVKANGGNYNFQVISKDNASNCVVK